MTKLFFLIITLLVTKNIVCQSDNKLLIGELTISQTTIERAKVGDTLAFIFTKKKFVGSIKLHSDSSIYAWATCTLGQKGYFWCKIGTWDRKKFVILNLHCKTIILKNITTDIGLGQQKLIIQDIW